MAIKWEDPPEAAFLSLRKGTYAEFALALKERPNEWAQVDRDFATEESAKNMASNVRRGGVTAMAKGQYEAVAHGKKVWCRYVGEAPAGEQPAPTPAPAEEPNRGHASRVRAWAKEKGIQISDHGRINEHIVRRYEQETGDNRS